MALQFNVLDEAMELDITSSSNASGEQAVARGVLALSRTPGSPNRVLAMMGSTTVPEIERNGMPSSSTNIAATGGDRPARSASPAISFPCHYLQVAGR